MDKNHIPQAVTDLSVKLPKLEDGRIDYTYAARAAVLNIFVEYSGEVLLLKRSEQVLAYQNTWNSIGGFLDDPDKTLKKKALEELREELNLNEGQISELHCAEPFEEYDANIERTWVIHPVLAKLKEKLDITLDWEHTDFRWIKPHELNNFNHVPGLKKVLEKLNPYL